MRFYGFEVAELTTRAEPNLSLKIRSETRVGLAESTEIPRSTLNKAPREMLLRIPGLGVRNVDRILRIRRWHTIRLDDLARCAFR
jgi:predicted DNA-binding helix-hairpin-helix protein